MIMSDTRMSQIEHQLGSHVKADFSIQAPMQIKGITFITAGACNSNYKKRIHLESLAATGDPAFDNANVVSVIVPERSTLSLMTGVPIPRALAAVR